METINLNNIKYNFIKPNISSNNEILICPDCKENLLPIDIIEHLFCPFCDYELKINNELEDYLLQPTINYFIYSNSMDRIPIKHF